MTDCNCDLGTLEHPQVAVVDDDPSVRRSLLRALRSCGYCAHAFSSAEEYLEASPVSAACLILDVHLTGMNGLELFEQIVGDENPPAVIVVTAHDTPSVEQRANDFGAAAFFPKPFDVGALLEVVARSLERENPAA